MKAGIGKLPVPAFILLSPKAIFQNFSLFSLFIMPANKTMLLLKYLCAIMSMLALAAPETNAQGGNFIWYFGYNAGIDFNTTPPTALYDGQLFTNEGCATLTDTQGNLLVYTDGVTVYNRLHQQMPNGFGLWGHSSSAQSAIIIPKPGSNSLYYIFTTENVEFPSLKRFSYSIVDMNLQNGLGDVINKNNLLHQPVAEFMNAVKHSNGIDYWITVHEEQSNNFITYLLTSSGVNPVSYTTSIEPVLSTNADLKGQLNPLMVPGWLSPIQAEDV